MKIAIMQPYFMPYIGYFQMIKSVDKFVFYDDVNFIKKGWINRNRILVNNKDFIFSIPLTKISQNQTINKTYINLETFEIWREKFNQTLFLNYKKAPNFKVVSVLLDEVFNSGSKTISRLAIESVIVISKYLQLKTEFLVSSEMYENREFNRKERLIDICKKENASHYINPIGGQELYKKEDFLAENIQLDFIKSKPIEYHQFKDEFTPWLSIIDVLMFNSVGEIVKMLDKYELV